MFSSLTFSSVYFIIVGNFSFLFQQEEAVIGDYKVHSVCKRMIKVRSSKISHEMVYGQVKSVQVIILTVEVEILARVKFSILSYKLGIKF